MTCHARLSQLYLILSDPGALDSWRIQSLGELSRSLALTFSLFVSAATLHNCLLSCCWIKECIDPKKKGGAAVEIKAKTKLTFPHCCRLTLLRCNILLSRQTACWFSAIYGPHISIRCISTWVNKANRMCWFQVHWIAIVRLFQSVFCWNQTILCI